MDKTIIPLFSTPVLVSKIDIDDWEINSALEYIKNLEYLKHYDIDGYENGYLSVDQYLLNNPEISKIKECIEGEIKNYLYGFLKLDKKIGIKHLSSWAVKHKYGDKCHMHKHLNSLFSGVLYLKVPENSGNKLIFENFYSNRSLDLNYEEYNYYNSTTWEVEVEEKTIIIFPSETYHKAPISKSNLERYCISFNYFVSGIIGHTTTYANF